MKKKKILIFLVPLLVLTGLFFLFRPRELQSATYGNLISASATLSNSRLSFYGGVGAGVSAGATTITLSTTPTTWGDINTNHLFPGDTVLVGDNDGITVGGIITSTSFFLSSGLGVSAPINSKIYVIQTGTLTVEVTTTNAVPASGDIIVTIPDPPSGQGNDSKPDTTTSLSTNGFDFNTIAEANITCPSDWEFDSVTPGSGNGHTVICNTGVGVTAGATLTLVVGNAAKGLVNPAPINTDHTQGTADIYTVDVSTRDASDNIIDDIDIKIAPIEAVLVSATVEETLSFQFEGLAAGSAACGKTMSVTTCNDDSCASTVSTKIPWGTLTDANTFYYAAQELTVSTNADGGYGVTIEEDDQLNKDFLADDPCDSPSDSMADETDNCIKDTPGDDAFCSESVEDDWETDTTNGFGFSLDNIDGTDAAFEYNVGSDSCEGTEDSDFCARQIADMQASETKENIMNNTAPVSGSNVYVCFAINISATQPAGYYINKVKYIVTAKF